MPRDPLWPFLLFEGIEGDALVGAYRQAYLETYVKDHNGERRMFTDWTGAKVSFSSFAFNHAFSKTEGYRQGLDHDQFSLERAMRMMWIKEVLSGSQGTINRYSQSRNTDRGKQVKRRTFLVCEENYLVVLNDPSGADKPFEFVTAFVSPDLDYIQKLKSRSALMECREWGKRK